MLLVLFYSFLFKFSFDSFILYSINGLIDQPISPSAEDKKKSKKRNKRQNKNRRKLKDGQGSSKDDSLDQDDDEGCSSISESGKPDPKPIVTQSIRNVISEEGSSFSEVPPTQHLVPDEDSERRRSVEQVAGEVVRNVIEMSLETLASSQRDTQGKDEPETNQDLIIQYVSCETETDPWKVSVSTQTFFKDRKKSCFDSGLTEDFKYHDTIRFHDDSDSCYSSSDSELDDDLLLECESMIISTNLAISTGLIALITGEMALNSEVLALEVGETALETGRIALECSHLRSNIEQGKTCPLTFTRSESGMGELDLVSEGEVNELKENISNRTTDDPNANDSYCDEKGELRTKEKRLKAKRRERKSLNHESDEEHNGNQFKFSDTFTQPELNVTKRITLPSFSSSSNSAEEQVSFVPLEQSTSNVVATEDIELQSQRKLSVSDELRKLFKPVKRSMEEGEIGEGQSWSRSDVGGGDQVQDAGKELLQIKSKTASNLFAIPKAHSHKLSPIFQSNEELISQDKTIAPVQRTQEESDLLSADEEYFKEQLKASIKSDEAIKNQFDQIIDDHAKDFQLYNELTQDIEQEHLEMQMSINEIFGDREKAILEEQNHDRHQIHDELERMEKEERELLATCVNIIESEEIEPNQMATDEECNIEYGEVEVNTNASSGASAEAVFERQEMIVIHDVPGETNVTSLEKEEEEESGEENKLDEENKFEEEDEETFSCEDAPSSGFYDVSQSQNLPPETENVSFTCVKLESSCPTVEYKFEEDRKINKMSGTENKTETSMESSKGPVSPPKVQVNEKDEVCKPPTEKDIREKNKKEKIEKLEKKVKAVIEKDGVSQPAIATDSNSLSEPLDTTQKMKNEPVQAEVPAVDDSPEEDVECSTKQSRNQDENVSNEVAQQEEKHNKNDQMAKPHQGQDQDKHKLDDTGSASAIPSQGKKEEKKPSVARNELQFDVMSVEQEQEKEAGMGSNEHRAFCKEETLKPEKRKSIIPLTQEDRNSTDSALSDKDVDDLLEEADGKSQESQTNSSSKSLSEVTKTLTVATNEVFVPSTSFEFKFMNEKMEEEGEKVTYDMGQKTDNVEQKEEGLKLGITKRKSITEKRKSAPFMVEAISPCPLLIFHVKKNDLVQEIADLQSNNEPSKKEMVEKEEETAEKEKETDNVEKNIKKKSEDVVNKSDAKKEKLVRSLKLEMTDEIICPNAMFNFNVDSSDVVAQFYDDKKVEQESHSERKESIESNNNEIQKKRSKKKIDKSTEKSDKCDAVDSTKNGDKNTIFKQEQTKTKKLEEKEDMISRDEAEIDYNRNVANIIEVAQGEVKEGRRSKEEVKQDTKIESAPDCKSSTPKSEVVNISTLNTEMDLSQLVPRSNSSNCQKDEDEKLFSSSNDDIPSFLEMEREVRKQDHPSSGNGTSSCLSRPSQSFAACSTRPEISGSSRFNTIDKERITRLSESQRSSSLYHTSNCSSEMRSKFAEIPKTIIRTNDVFESKFDRTIPSSLNDLRMIRPAFSSCLDVSCSTERNYSRYSSTSLARSPSPFNLSTASSLHSRITSPSHFSSDTRRGEDPHFSVEGSRNKERRSRSLVKSRMRNREEVRDISTRELLDRIWDRVEERKRKFNVESQNYSSIPSRQGVECHHYFQSSRDSSPNVNSTAFLTYGSLSYRTAKISKRESSGPREMASCTISSSVETSWKRLHDRLEQVHPHNYGRRKRDSSLPCTTNVTRGYKSDSIPSTPLCHSYSCDYLNKVEEKYKSMLNLRKSTSFDTVKRDIASKRRTFEAEIDDIDYHIFSARLYAEESEDIQETILGKRCSTPNYRKFRPADKDWQYICDHSTFRPKSLRRED